MSRNIYNFYFIFVSYKETGLGTYMIPKNLETQHSISTTENRRRQTLYLLPCQWFPVPWWTSSHAVCWVSGSTRGCWSSVILLTACWSHRWSPHKSLCSWKTRHLDAHAEWWDGWQVRLVWGTRNKGGCRKADDPTSDACTGGLFYSSY